MREARLYTNESWLHQRYWTDKLSTRKIGTLCGVEGGTIRKHMRKLNIPARTVSEAYREGYGVSPYRDKKWLYREYWKKGGTLRSIAEMCGRDRTTIRDWFEEFGIPVRSRAEWQAKVTKANRKRCHVTWYNRILRKIKSIVKRLDDYMKKQDTVDN